MPFIDPNLLALAVLLLVLGAAPAGLAWLRGRRHPALGPWTAPPKPMPLFLEQPRSAPRRIIILVEGQAPVRTAIPHAQAR